VYRADAVAREGEFDKGDTLWRKVDFNRKLTMHSMERYGK